VVKLFNSLYPMSNGVDDHLKLNDTVLWQVSKGDFAVIDSAQE